MAKRSFLATLCLDSNQQRVPSEHELREFFKRHKAELERLGLCVREAHIEKPMMGDDED